MWSIAGDVLLTPKQGAPTLHSVDCPESITKGGQCASCEWEMMMMMMQEEQTASVWERELSGELIVILARDFPNVY